MMTSEKPSMPMTYYMKAGMIRTEVSGERGQITVVMIDPAKREMTMLMPQQKMSMVHQMAEPAKANVESQGQAQAPQVDFQRPGQYETILG